jgi:hypothetical protein
LQSIPSSIWENQVFTSKKTYSGKLQNNHVDIISYDFDKTISKEKCLENVLSNVVPGSIVFHDRIKHGKTLNMYCQRL